MPDSDAITLTSTVSAASQQVWSELAGEVVILNMDLGVYHGLGECGAAVWRWIQSPTRVDRLIENVLAEYDVSPATAAQDVLELLNDLHAHGLLTAHQTAAA